MMILELIALTALTRLIRLHGAEEKSDLMIAMRHAIDRKCHDVKLCGIDRELAEKYAEELLACAEEQASATSHVTASRAIAATGCAKVVKS